MKPTRIYKTFMSPGDKVEMIDGEILTVKSLEFTSFVPKERPEYIPKKEILNVFVDQER